MLSAGVCQLSLVGVSWISVHPLPSMPVMTWNCRTGVLPDQTDAGAVVEAAEAAVAAKLEIGQARARARIRATLAFIVRTSGRRWRHCPQTPAPARPDFHGLDDRPASGARGH